MNIKTDYAPSPFESFNARALTPDRVAKSFIPPFHFRSLIERKHHLLIGPRGSGKTTLLKMLQPQALNVWQHDSADEVRGSIDFTGVFIPTDISWKSQIDSLMAGGFSSGDADVISFSLFCTNVMRSLCAALEDRISESASKTFRGVSVSTETESRIAQSLGEEWGLSLKIPSLAGVNLALGSRLMQIHVLAAQELRRGSDGRSDRLNSIDLLFLDFLSSSSIFIDIVEAHIPEIKGEIWALLFDELELAPNSIREKLLQSLRSTDSRILFKLSMSPYDSRMHILDSPISAMVGQDYDEINLTYSDSRAAYSFCSALTSRILADSGWKNLDATNFLGDSILSSNSSHLSVGDYARHGAIGKMFYDLSQSDSSFAEYLARYGIDPADLNSSSRPIRDAQIRKVRSIVAVRSGFRSTDSAYANTNRRIRSRKNPELYAGAASLFAISEGNPRWLIGVVTQLVHSSKTKDKMVPKNLQSREIGRVSDRFRALLKTIPTSPQSPSKQRGLLSTLDQIGEFVHEQVILGPFNPDPVGTFVVDSNAEEWLLDSLGRSLNAGAIVYVPDSEASIILSSLRGKRFRLSYALSPYYSTPIQLFREVSLNRILHRRKTDSGGQSMLAIDLGN